MLSTGLAEPKKRYLDTARFLAIAPSAGLTGGLHPGARLSYEGTSALGPAILPPIIPHKTRPNYALTQEVKSANDAVDGRWQPQEQQETTTTVSNEAKVQKRTTPNNTATSNTSIPAPMATPEQVGMEGVLMTMSKMMRRTAMTILTIVISRWVGRW